MPRTTATPNTLPVTITQTRAIEIRNLLAAPFDSDGSNSLLPNIASSLFIYHLPVYSPMFKILGTSTGNPKVTIVCLSLEHWRLSSVYLKDASVDEFRAVAEMRAVSESSGTGAALAPIVCRE